MADRRRFGPRGAGRDPEEDPARNGPTAPETLARAPAGTTAHEKPVFGPADVPVILGAVEALDRRTAVLVGFETDVCVTHSAIGLMQTGFQVAVLADVTDSPGDAHPFGLERMREAGALVMSLKGLYFEWIRNVSTSNMWDDVHLKRIGLPKGIIL